MRGWVWVNLVLAAWLVLAPWILGYRGTPATNDVIVGLAVGIVSIILLATSRAAAEPAVTVPRREEAMPMTASAMRDMAAALARLPDAERRTMMGERLRMFAEMPEEERKRAMGAMVEGVAALLDEDKKKLFRARFEILAELTDAQRNNLMMMHMAILMGKGSQMMQKEMELTQAIMPQLSPSVRQMVQMMMEKMGKGGMG